MGGSSGGTEIIQPPIRTDAPLQNELTNAARAQMMANDPYNPAGRGDRLTPQANFAQVAFPGPQQTIYGQAGFNPASYTPAFGQSAVNQGAINQAAGYGGGQGGGSGQGGGQNTPPPPFMPANGQQVLAPFQQFFPGILPTFGVPPAYGGGYNLQPTPQNGVTWQPIQSPFAQPPAPQQQQPQQNQNNSQSQQGASQQQPPAQAPSQPQQPQLSPQEEAMRQQWINAVLSGGGSLPTNYQNGVFT